MERIESLTIMIDPIATCDHTTPIGIYGRYQNIFYIREFQVELNYVVYTYILL